MALEPITFFQPDDDHGWLSALSPHPVVVDGRTYPTAEHYYQARKFQGHPLIQMEIAGTPDPLAAKAIARREKARRPADWHPDQALAAFRAAMVCKFAQHPELAAALRITGDRPLVEAALEDGYWGSGPDGTGENWVGQILMEIRAALPAVKAD